MDDTTGEYRRPKRDVRIPTWVLSLIVSVIVAGGGIAIAVGQYEQRFSSVEHTQHEQAQDAKQRDAKLASHDTEIAVLGDKLDTVLQQLAVVNSKLDRLDDEDISPRRVR